MKGVDGSQSTADLLLPATKLLCEPGMASKAAAER